MPISFSCDGCGKSYQVDDSLAGKRVKCKSCASTMAVPNPAASAPSRAPAPPAGKPALKSFGVPEPPRSTAPKRPATSAPQNIYGLDEDEMEEAKSPSYDDEFAPPMRRPGQVKAKSTRSSTYRSDPIPGTTGMMLYVNLAFLGLIVILGLVSLVAPPAFVLFALLGFGTAIVLALIGLVWSLTIAFRESVAAGLLFLFVPFYSLFYLITRWSEMKRPFVVNLVGGGVYFYALIITTAVVLKGSVPATPPGQGPAAPVKFVTAEELQADPTALPGVAPRLPALQPDGKDGQQVAGQWKAQADPPAEKLVWPAGNAVAAQVPPNFSSDKRIIYPAVASPFVVIGGNDTGDQFREVWDLRGPGRVVGRIAGNVNFGYPMMLSPEGTHFAGHDVAVPRKLVIFDVPTGQPIGAIPDGNVIPDIGEFVGPNLILLGTSYSKILRVWDYSTGKVLREIDLKARIIAESFSLSPGRRYAAFVTASPERLKLVDLTTGTVVGEDLLPKDGNSDYACEGTAFSADGAMLTGLFGCGFDAAHLVTWDVASGKRLSDFRYPGYNPFKTEHGYHGAALQWLPDGSGWLVRDKTFVERESGKLVWTIPFDANNGTPEAPRMLMDADRMIASTGKRDSEVLRVVPLPRDKIETASGIARNGGDITDAILPKLQSVDMTNVKIIAPPAAAVTWLVRPDELRKPKKPFVLKPTPLTAKMDQIQSIRFSGPESATAIVSSGLGAARAGQDTARQGEKPSLVERVNLSTGRVLNHFDIPPVCELAAVSPDGSRAALIKIGGRDRIDVDNTTDGSHVVGWRPYEKAADSGKTVVSCEFVDANSILTSSGDGTIVLWALPECRAVYSMDKAATGPFLLSPARKWAAIIAGDTLRLFEPATGTIKGEIALPSGLKASGGLEGAAFRWDGQELAAILDGQVVRFDLTKGEVIEEFPVPYSSAASLEYAVKGYLLLDDKALFDLSKKKIVWIYDGGPHATGSPNGAHWFATGRPYEKASLTFKALPETTVIQAVAAAFDVKTKSMLGEGSTVSIQIEGQSPRAPDEFRTAIFDGLVEQLQAVGATAADDAPTKLIVRIRDTPTGKSLHFRRMTFGPGGSKQEDLQIPEHQVDYDVVLQDKSGTTIPLQAERYRTSTGMFMHVPGEEKDLEGYLRTDLWNQARTRLLSIGLPFFVAKKPGDAIIILPGLTRLNPATR